MIRREKNRHRPSTMALIHGSGGLHVDFIDIRPFFAIDFDIDKIPVHQISDGVIFKRLPFHHVAPVASRIAN